ncbi:MAG: glycosyltransferase [Patescibacteria group bacterium]|jgi:glycosyltransferase involved in cell wall biosynthesis
MSTRQKLLFLVTSSAWGGAERYVSRLARAASAEFDVTVAAGHSPKSELFSSLPSTIRTIEIPELRQPISPISDLFAVRTLRRLIDREGYDILHTNSSKAGLLGAIAAWRSKHRPRVVYTAHGWGFLERRSALFRLTLLLSEKIAARLRTATITLSDMERDVALRNKLATRENLAVIPLGIDRDEVDFLEHDAAHARLAELCGTRLGHLVLGTIANAYPAKNLPMLFEAFEGVAAEFTNLDLVILGDGPEMPRLRTLHAALPHKDRVHLPGAIKDAATLLKGFDIFVLPSTKEGMPWTILEASLAELPIIATRVGALPELINDRQTGILVEPGDREALRRAIRDVLSDRTLYQELKSGAPRIAERRSGTVMTESVLALYRSLSRRS